MGNVDLSSCEGSFSSPELGHNPLFEATCLASGSVLRSHSMSGVSVCLLFRSRDSWLLPPPEEEEAGIESEAPSPRLKRLRKMRAVLRS